jgi:hypothetical protein
MDKPKKDEEQKQLEEEAKNHDNYWQGQADAELYHDDIGDR